jgi:hypothetical protein
LAGAFVFSGKPQWLGSIVQQRSPDQICGQDMGFWLGLLIVSQQGREIANSRISSPLLSLFLREQHICSSVPDVLAKDHIVFFFPSLYYSRWGLQLEGRARCFDVGGCAQFGRNERETGTGGSSLRG